MATLPFLSIVTEQSSRIGIRGCAIPSRHCRCGAPQWRHRSAMTPACHISEGGDKEHVHKDCNCLSLRRVQRVLIKLLRIDCKYLVSEDVSIICFFSRF
jgi:hypothetical protein